METLNISLPKTMKKYVRDRVAAGGYGNTSEYVRELIRAEQKQRARTKLETLLLEGINSGPAVPVDEEFWKTLRKEIENRVQAKKK